jgi:hypothetical protein
MIAVELFRPSSCSVETPYYLSIKIGSLVIRFSTMRFTTAVEDGFAQLARQAFLKSSPVACAAVPTFAKI